MCFEVRVPALISLELQLGTPVADLNLRKFYAVTVIDVAGDDCNALLITPRLLQQKGVRAMANPSKHKSGEGGRQTNGGQSGGQLMHNRPRHLLPSFGPWGRLRTEFDRLFDDFMHGLPVWGGERQSSWGLDVQESEDAIMIRADAPGFDADDFDIEVRGDNLVLCACQSEEKTQDDEGYHWEKRELYRSVPLPAHVDTEKIDAQYRNGVLSVKLPKSEKTKARKIEVKS
jgi:HSP20 family protein